MEDRFEEPVAKVQVVVPMVRGAGNKPGDTVERMREMELYKVDDGAIVGFASREAKQAMYEVLYQWHEENDAN